ncbi:MAG: hypothetical protein ACRDXC_12265, partial [Acidimicrobiales bacterium]
DKVIGRCTSSAWCPGLGKVGALAYLHRSVGDSDALVWAAYEGAPDPQRRPAQARPLPLVE